MAVRFVTGSLIAVCLESGLGPLNGGTASSGEKRVGNVPANDRANDRIVYRRRRRRRASLATRGRTR